MNSSKVKKDPVLQEYLQKIIEKQEQEILILRRTNHELTSMLAISQKDVSKLQKQLKEIK